MRRLSSPLSAMKAHYTVIVVGSGYGGGVTASRMARAGQGVALLERGREILPGEYPDTLLEADREMQIETASGRIGSRLGLFDFHAGPDISALVGCGLGGTSLINANVALRADPRVFDDPCWPDALRGDLPTLVEDGYTLAEQMLRPTPYPTDSSPLPKLDALEASAKGLGKSDRFYRPPINVTFGASDVATPNHAGVEQKGCILCGDCVSGCNHSAKNTTLMNYLPDAHSHGAEIYTCVSVRWIERRDNRWVVHYQSVGEDRDVFNAPPSFVTADLVVLSAGTLGSTEILLRSKAQGLPLSDRIGERFTGNGDVLAFGYDCAPDISGVGFGHRQPAAIGPVGPCITGVIDLRNSDRLDDGFVIEDGSIPGALASILPASFEAAATGLGEDENPGFLDRLKRRGHELLSLVLGAYRGAVRHTQTYLVMAHDGTAGRLALDQDRLSINWPGVGKEPIFDTINTTLEQATKAIHGTHVPDPLWSKLLGHRLVTVHPLGGCGMADDAEHGVVNHKGQVFADSTGHVVHDGLYVADGSVIPRSLGVNPLLTITALAERACRLAAADRGWTIDYSSSSLPASPPAVDTIGIRFTETMRGFFSTAVTDDYARAADAGELVGSTMAFTLTITSANLDDMLQNDAHVARIDGTVLAPALSPLPLAVSGGVFQLFVNDPTEVDTRRMNYRMRLSTEDGRAFFFDGFKRIHDSPMTASWAQTTTLYVTVHDGADDRAPIFGQGILHIAPSDFLKQLTTMEALNAPNLAAKLKALGRFGNFFAGILFETYGGVFARETYFNPDAPPRKKRPLRVNAPEVHTFQTSDGVSLRLTRYRGGSKGPVLMVHGAGVSSAIFSTDLIDTNLLEFVHAHGYDVWLFDFRVSIDLAASDHLSNGDQIARIDHPEAVAYVLNATGAESVQAVVHCYGANTFFMAMLAGMRGVRSIVCSQIATHLVVGTPTKIKSSLHTPNLLGALGVTSLSAYVDQDANWRNRLFDDALRLYPVSRDELCRDPVCHRITFLYALLYEHAQLDQVVHDHLHELFGVGNIKTFEHLALMVRKGHVVSADGEDVYVPHVERLALPIRFVHGAENVCYLPKSTELTCDWLRQANPPGLYSRVVIPNYGHIDCIFGPHAANDVYPHILEHLEATL